MEKNLSVLLSAYACLPNSGTEPGNGWNWAVQLALRGIRVHVLTTIENQAQIEAFCAETPTLNVSFSYVEVPWKLRHTSRLHYACWQLSAVKVARRLHRDTPFDLVHHVTYSSIHVPTQLWRIGVPTIFGPVGGGQRTTLGMLSGFGYKCPSEVFHSVLTGALRYSPIHRIWLNKMALVLVTNADTLRLVRKITKTQVAPWFDAALSKEFLESAPRQFTDKQGPLRLLWVGRMVPRKALPIALAAVSQVRCPVTLTIAGSGLPPDAVDRLISGRGLEERVSWARRRLSRAEVREAYLNHDALLFTSLRDSCPAQLLEAMALGLPVIALDQHGARDLVPNGAGIKIAVSTPAKAATEMAAAIDRFALLTPAARSEMSETGWKFAQSLNYQDGAAVFQDLYNEILAHVSPVTAIPKSGQRIQDRANSECRILSTRTEQ